MKFRISINLIVFLISCLFLNIVNAQISFVDEAENLGIDITCGTTYIGNGVTFFDYDKDGWDDITFTTENGQPVRFFKNQGGTSFIEQTLNITNLTYQTKQVNWLDFDNDGDNDIYITSNTNGNKLFENDGNLNFLDITVDAGLPTSNIFTYGTSWGDYNNDGFLDVFISSFDSNKIIPNYLYKNNGDGTFTNVSTIAGISPLGHLSFCSAFFDYNNDGWQDIYIANDRIFNPNILYKNNGDGTFTDTSIESGTNVAIDAMSVTIDDFNSDGWLDIFVTNGVDGNVFFKNNKDGTFSDIATTSGTLLNSVCWGAVFLDAENDADLDLYVSSSLNGVSIYSSSKFYENLGNEIFKTPNNPGFFNDVRASHSNAIGDIDNDGLNDIIVSNTDDGDVNLWKNSTSTSNNWLKIKLEGVVSNRDGIGSFIEISTNGKKQYRYTLCGEGYLSQNSATEIFGLGNNTIVDYIKIKWLSGLEEFFYNVSANQLLEIIEGSGTLSNEIFGCTNDDSCNYNPNATVNDGSCVFLVAGEIIGSSIVNPLNIEDYSYLSNVGDQFLWTAENGEIINGQGTNQITVKWHIATQGTVSVINKNNNCSTNPVLLNVDIEKSKDKNFSVARLWNEVLLEAIRNDYARPTVHARNLFHLSAAMYDAWAIYNPEAETYFIGKEVNGFSSVLNEFNLPQDIGAGINETLSYAAYRILKHRFNNSPNANKTLAQLDDLMSLLNYDINVTSIFYVDSEPAALGNYIGSKIIEYGLQDGSNEVNDYENIFYQPVNSPLVAADSGNETISDPNRWQPLSLDVFIDQSGNVISENTTSFLSPEWGNSSPFALNTAELTNYERDSNSYRVFHDPGQPPYIGTGNTESSDVYKWGFSLVSVWGSHLSPNDGVLLDISPNSIGNISSSLFPNSFTNYSNFYKLVEGGDIGNGYSLNPVTNMPYSQQIVLRGDYTRVLAEFWADGPDSETPPGHWFTLLNYVSDHPLLEKRMKGEGEILSNLEWDIKSYFILGGAMHDSAVAAWGIKGWYDYIRPISAIRYMAENGQSTDASLSNYHENGIPLMDGYVEVVLETDELAGDNGQHVGKIKIYSWRGHAYINNIETDEAGVGWILAENWWPYQRPSFVTPPFAGYVSGHSTYSRAAAEVMTKITGNEFFPGGMGEFVAKKNEFLVFEDGPSQDIILQWATYRDASDQCSLSRIWGGIHPPMDDIPGRIIGEQIGVNAFNLAESYFYNNIQNISESEMVLFPNPITELKEITITNTSLDQEFLFFDMFGKLIPIKYSFIKENKRTQFKIGNLSTGIYVLKSKLNTWKVIIK